VGIALAWVLDKKVHGIPITSGARFENVGLVLLIAGLGLMTWGLLTFARARTGIMPGQPANQIVTRGPYRYTRNPMYTGMAIAYLGGCFILNSWWCVIIFPVVMWLVLKLVIQKEEAYLGEAFPDEYTGYRRRVRRWL
jgi:protein-S-isoprenylcysteine O-methyltransferase Ste14